MPLLPRRRPVADPAQLTDLANAVERLAGQDLASLRLGIAVSGGPDSMALLHLAQQLPLATVEAATIDHGLRRDSADEAAMVGQYCAAQGVEHQILTPTAPSRGRFRLPPARYAMRCWRSGARFAGSTMS
ncbi:MAG: hypothetical protein HC788_00670 [Sphingopyxis sp.]|nr:hypothetical protein [Sphingopyxis sp.]